MEPAFLSGPHDLPRDPAARAHRTPPQRVAIRVAEGHVGVRPASDAGGDVVDVEILLAIHAGLEGERSHDPRGVMLLRRLHPFLREAEDLVQCTLPEGRGVVTNHDVPGDPLEWIQRELLVRGKADVPVEGRLDPPVDAEELQPLAPPLERRVEEVEVEDGPDDVALDPGCRQVRFRDYALLEQCGRLLPVLLRTRRGEEPALEFLRLVRELHDHEGINVRRIVDLLRVREARFLEEPVVALLLRSLLRAEEVPAPEEGHEKLVLDRADVAVRRERPIRNEHRVPVPEVFLHFLRQDFRERVEDARLVDYPTHELAPGVPHRTEVPSVRRLPAALADRDRAEPFLDGTVAHIERGMGRDHADGRPALVVSLEDLQDPLPVDHTHPLTVCVPMREAALSVSRPWRVLLHYGSGGPHRRFRRHLNPATRNRAFAANAVREVVGMGLRGPVCPTRVEARPQGVPRAGPRASQEHGPASGAGPGGDPPARLPPRRIGSSRVPEDRWRGGDRGVRVGPTHARRWTVVTGPDPAPHRPDATPSR